MIIDQNNIKEILKEIDLKPSKDHGQNYLISPQTSEKIVSLLKIEEGDSILEIGPGLGSLTHFIQLTRAKCDVLDIDDTSCNFLEYIYKDSHNLKIINGNAIKYFDDIYNKIISNIPYNITSDLIEHLLIHFNVKRYVFMCQNEVYTRLSSIKGSEYCPLSVLISLIGNIKKEFVVSPNNFYPSPKCGSTVFVIDVINKNNETLKAYKLVKILFTNRRQTILNNLTRIINNKETAKSILEKCNINISDRPDTISPIKYLELAKFIKD